MCTFNLENKSLVTNSIMGGYVLAVTELVKTYFGKVEYLILNIKIFYEKQSAITGLSETGN